MPAVTARTSPELLRQARKRRITAATPRVRWVAFEPACSARPNGTSPSVAMRCLRRTLRADHGYSIPANPQTVHAVGTDIEQRGVRGVMPVAGKKCPLAHRCLAQELGERASGRILAEIGRHVAVPSWGMNQLGVSCFMPEGTGPVRRGPKPAVGVSVATFA